ncbi:hypothetical protein SBRCBS47491_001291 [Sporothrix bragantina]|uniref:Uncharacterized protein n=1 Tax=Sporothrix bragantina TaxID=671064 RepID=A0ABP0AXD8_9PEZI
MHLTSLSPALIVAASLRPAVAIPWLSSQQDGPDYQKDFPSPSYSSISPSDLLQDGAQQRSALYQRALIELQELEAEPLCHRVAARLLVNNCHLLDGKDDATLHTDSGRRARDFVDSYAASLAICDLERANFHIPAACAAFREPMLSQIPLSDNEAHLHVSEAQIRACLTGLGESPSAWNTWVSYSHKAVRFCEAARADHEKTQNILVFQKLTRVMAKLADDVEAELQRRMEAWDVVVQDTASRMDGILPTADAVWQRLRDAESLLASHILSSLGEATASAEEGARSAEALKQLLAIMVKSALEANSEMAYAHEQSMELVVQRTDSELDMLATTMQSAFVSAMSLQREISLENGMVQLVSLTQTFMTNMTDHTRLLAQANNMTNDMLDTLEATAAATSTIQNAFWGYGDRADTAAPAAPATTRSATRSKTAAASIEVRPPLFGPLELEPAGGAAPQQEQAEAREGEADLPQQPPQDVPAQEQEQEKDGIPRTALLWDLYSDGERANPRADSEDEDNNDMNNDVIHVDGATEAPITEAVVPADNPEEPKRKRQRVASARSRGRKQGQSVASVVETVSAAMEKAKSTPTKSMGRGTRAERAEKRRQMYEEVEEQQQQKEAVEVAKEQEAAPPPRQEAPVVDQEQKEQDEEGEERGQEEAEAGEGEMNEQGRGGKGKEAEVEPPRRKTPKRQTKLSAKSKRARYQLQQKEAFSQPSQTAESGVEEEEADKNGTNDDNGNEDNRDADRDSIYVQSEGTAKSRTPRSTGITPRRAAKRKRGQPQPAEEAISDMEEEEVAGGSIDVQEALLIPAAQPAESDQPQRRPLPEWLQPDAAGGPSKSADVSTKTVTAIVQLMSGVGWTGMHTWKMSLPRGNPVYSVQPATKQAQELCWRFSKLMQVFTDVPQPEALLDQQGQDNEQSEAAMTTSNTLDSFWEGLEAADIMSGIIDEDIDAMCNEELNPVTAIAYASTAAARQTARLRALLAEDLLAFVIPHAVAVLEAAYALGGRVPDEELDLQDTYVPRGTVQLNRATWHTARKVAIWLIKLENVLAYELGYRAERDILGRYQNPDDSDDEDDDYRHSNAGLPRGGMRTPHERFGRRGRPRLNRPSNGPASRNTRPSLSGGEAMDAALYQSTPGAKRRSRCRLKPLLNQLQDEICRARIDIERNNRTSRPSSQPATATGIDGVDDIAMDSDDESSSWVPVEIAAKEPPQSQAEVNETPRHGESLELVLPQQTPMRPAPAAQGGQHANAEGQESDDGVEDDDQDEPLMTPATEAPRQLGGPVETQAEEDDSGSDGLHVRRREPSAAKTPRAAQRAQVSQAWQATQATQATPSRAPRPSQPTEVEPPAVASSPFQAQPSPARPRTAQTAPVRAPPVATPVKRVEAPPAAPAASPTINTDTTSPEPGAYTTAELKLILVRLRRLKGTAQLDLVRLAADFGRDVYDVASRVEGIKNVVRATALREKKPVPHWAQAGYIIR